MMLKNLEKQNKLDENKTILCCRNNSKADKRR